MNSFSFKFQFLLMTYLLLIKNVASLLQKVGIKILLLIQIIYLNKKICVYLLKLLYHYYYSFINS
jgi:hypothetical protein